MQWHQTCLKDNANSCETSWKRPPRCSNLNQDVQPLCSIRSILGMQLPFVRDRTEFHITSRVHQSCKSLTPQSPTSSRRMPPTGALGQSSVGMISWEKSILLLSQVASSCRGRLSTQRLRRSALQLSELCSFSTFTCMGSHSQFRLTTNLLPGCRE